MPGLDALRALCITLVIVSHVGFGQVVPGGLGVTIFFFISGFLITRLLLAEGRRYGRLDLPRFWGRRVVRLAPELLGLLTVLSLVSGPLLREPLRIGAGAAALTYVMNYYVIFFERPCADCAAVGHLWSLAVEEHFYLIMPVIMAMCGLKARRLAVFLIATLVLAPLWRLFADDVLRLSSAYLERATECRLDSIAWGALAAVVEVARPAAAARVRRAWPWALGLGLVALAVSLAVRDAAFRETLRFSLQGAALFMATPALIAAAETRPGQRLLEHPWLLWAGRRSYGAYLYHYLAIAIVSRAFAVAPPLEAADHPTQLKALPLVMALTFVMAGLSHRWVYRPAQRLKPRLTPRWSPPMTATA